MRRAVVAAGVLLCLAVAGCFRTTYMNIKPPRGLAVAADDPKPASSWQHFFFFGLIPGERVIRADHICGSSNAIGEVHTEQTFVQGLVEMLTSFYVNIYSPWTGKVTCTRAPAR